MRFKQKHRYAEYFFFRYVGMPNCSKNNNRYIKYGLQSDVADSYWMLNMVHLCKLVTIYQISYYINLGDESYSNLYHLSSLSHSGKAKRIPND